MAGTEDEMENDEMGSLFEGMVLFTSSPTTAMLSEDPSIAAAASTDDRFPQTSEAAHDSLSSASASASASAAPLPPLDENLFADLSLVVEENPQKDEILKGDHPSATLQVSSSRKKKRAAGLRIGYGRDRDRDQEDTSPNPNEEKDHHRQLKVEDQTPPPASFSAHPPPAPQFSEEPETELKFQEIRMRVAQKLDNACQAVTCVSAARKAFIRDRRRVAQLLSEATAKYGELEKELDEACEDEDFEKAELLGESLAAADKHQEGLLLALREAESHSDALDSKMLEALDSQIRAEEECASLLQRFALVSGSTHNNSTKY